MGEIHRVQQKADKAEDHFTVGMRVQHKLLTDVHNTIEFHLVFGVLRLSSMVRNNCYACA